MYVNRENHAGVRKLIKRNFRTQKLKNILLFLTLLFLTCFFTCIIFISYNQYKNLERYSRHVNGISGDAVFRKVSREGAKQIKNSSLCSWMGESRLIGDVTNEELSSQYIQLRYADENYARAVYAIPDVGTMPQHADEIAAGVNTLKKLGVPIALNEELVLCWKEKGGVCKKKFQLSGYWEEEPEVHKNFIWASKEVLKDDSNMEIVVSFEENMQPEQQADRLASELGISKDACYITAINRKSIFLEIICDSRLWIVLLIVFVQGFLMINSIQQISIAGNSTFYGRIKAMGAEEKQIRQIIWNEVWIVTLFAVPVGLSAGYTVGRRLIPKIINGSLMYTQIYVNRAIFLLPVLFVLLTIACANAGPALQAGKTDIEKAFKYKGYGDNCVSRSKKYPGLPVLIQLSMENITRYKKRLFVAMSLLVIGLLWISVFHVIRISFDQSKYLEAVSISDFSICSDDVSKENKGNENFKKCAQQIVETEGITRFGFLYLQKEEQVLPDDVYEQIKNYYEKSEKERLNDMAYDTLWMRQYNDLIASHSCNHQIWGIGRLPAEEMMKPQYLIQGSFDPDKFVSERYVIAQGIPGDQETKEQEPTYLPGDRVIIRGMEYEVMGVAEIPIAVKQGMHTVDQGFELSFYMSDRNFQKLFPKVYPQKLFLDVTSAAEETVTEKLETLEKQEGFSFTSKARLTDEYQKDVFTQSGMEMLVGAALLIMGVIQMIHSIASAMIDRKKEFLLMYRIGMTQRQIRCMLVLESVNCMLLTVSATYVLSIWVISTIVKDYVTSQWACTFCFSIGPLLILTPAFMVLAVTVPQILYRMQHIDLERIY